MALDRWLDFQASNPLANDEKFTHQQLPANDKVHAWFDKIDEHNAYPIDEISNVSDILKDLLNKSIDYDIDFKSAKEEPVKAKPQQKRVRIPSGKRLDMQKRMDTRHAIVKQRALERQEKDKKRLEEKLAAKNAAAEEQRVKLMEEKIKLDILRKENDARNRFKKEVAKTSHPVAAIKFGPNFNVNNKKGMF